MADQSLGPALRKSCSALVSAPQTLSLQRQMMENLVIAKAREETVSFLGGSPAPTPDLASF